MAIVFGLVRFKNGNISDADEVLSNTSFTLTNMLRMMIDGITITNQLHATLDLLTSTSNIDTANTTAYYDVNLDAYLFAQIFDDFADASIDATKWTVTGSTTETGGYLNLPDGGDTAISDGASGFDGRSFSGNSEIILDVDPNNGDSGADWTLQISNGSTHVNIDSGNGTATRKFYRVVINKSGETMDVYKNDALLSNDVDISSVTTNWYLRFTRVNSIAKDLKIYHVGYAESGISGTQDVVTSAVTATATTAEGLLTPIMSVGAVSSSEIALSANNGSNYTSGDINTMIEASVAGTQIKWRFRVAFETTISATAKNIPTLTSFAHYHG